MFDSNLSTMVIASTIARIVLGMAFAASGIMPFFMPNSPPQPSASIVPMLLPTPVVVLILWLLIALRYRSLFAPIFAPQPARDPIESRHA